MTSMAALSPSSRKKVHSLPLQRMTSDAASFTQKASALAGKFKGNGTAFLHGKEVAYTEECCFTVIRKNPKMTVYKVQQDTRHESKTLHLEIGVLKILNDPDSSSSAVLKAEAGMTHPLSKQSMHEQSAKGSLDTSTGTLILESTGFEKVNGDKHVTALRRVYRRQGRKLMYDQYLGLNGCKELIHHLHCELELEE